MFDINEIKKDLYRSKNMANFSHYTSGNMYYTVELADGVFQFIIPTIEPKRITIGNEEEVHGADNLEVLETIKLSEDLGSTSFFKEMKGSELIRWIQKSINSNDFIKVG
jgi:hypothetical protein